MLMAVTPVLAKPNTMTVILKDSAGKPVYPAHVYIINLDDDVQQLQPNGYVNRQGKVNIPTPGDMYARPWLQATIAWLSSDWCRAKRGSW